VMNNAYKTTVIDSLTIQSPKLSFINKLKSISIVTIATYVHALRLTGITNQGVL